tara:strand:- start:520 stop:741 length:222 start_codon:yes stop_codon:yes gene_type:complete
MDDLFAPLVLGLLTWVIFTLHVVNSKMPVVISCDCFNDLSHDEMKQLKEEYLLSKQEQLKEQEEDGVSVEKED